jgi:hypothetical protein
VQLNNTGWKKEQMFIPEDFSEDQKWDGHGKHLENHYKIQQYSFRDNETPQLDGDIVRSNIIVTPLPWPDSHSLYSSSPNILCLA